MNDLAGGSQCGLHTTSSSSAKPRLTFQIRGLMLRGITTSTDLCNMKDECKRYQLLKHRRLACHCETKLALPKPSS